MIAVMSNVVLPTSDPKAVEYLTSSLDKRHNMYVVARYELDSLNNKVFYVRLSGQIYLELIDFIRLGELVVTLLKEHVEISI